MTRGQIQRKGGQDNWRRGNNIWGKCKEIRRVERYPRMEELEAKGRGGEERVRKCEQKGCGEGRRRHGTSAYLCGAARSTCD
jgi:hypothetical protein